MIRWLPIAVPLLLVAAYGLRTPLQEMARTPEAPGERIHLSQKEEKLQAIRAVAGFLERSDQEGIHAHLRPDALMIELHQKEDSIRRSLGQAKGGAEPVIRWLALNRMGRDLDSWQPELNRMRWIHVVTRREKRSDLKAAVSNIAVYFKQLPRGNSLRYDLLGLTQGIHDELPGDEPLAWETEDLMLQEIAYMVPAGGDHTVGECALAERVIVGLMERMGNDDRARFKEKLSSLELDPVVLAAFR